MNVLFQGRSKTAQYLLDIGAPVGIVNTLGIPAMSYIAEKMPEVAYHALSQYMVSSKLETRYYLHTLDNYGHKSKTVEKSPLEVWYLTIIE